MAHDLMEFEGFEESVAQVKAIVEVACVTIIEG